MAEFKGVVPAIITPKTPEGGLNEAAFREVMEFDIRAGVHGFWVAGGTGESILLTDEENMRLAEIAADQNQGRTNVIMHVGAPTTDRAARLAEHAAGAGVDAICCVPPFFYPHPDEAIVEHYRVVAAAAGLPFFAYNLPNSTGVEITPELAKKIQERVPQFVGLKHSSLDFGHIYAFRDLGLRCFTGAGRLMLPGLTIGAAGCVDGPLCGAPELWVEIWNAYHNGDMSRAEAAQRRGEQLFQVLVRFGFYASIKAMLSERLGVECGAPRPPLPPLTPEQRDILRDDMARLGFSPVAVGQADD